MRLRLYQCALRLFIEKSYEQTTFDDIAEEADVSRTTVFNYFGRKEDFLLAWSDGRRQRVRDLLDSADVHETSTRALVLQAATALASINETERQATLQLIPAWVRTGAPVTELPYFATLFAEVVARGQKLGDVVADIDATEVGHMLRQLYLGVLFRWVANNETSPPFELERTLVNEFDLLLRGLVIDRD